MSDYSKPLGDAIKRARIRQNLTEKEVADAIHIDDRTVLNIENYKGNPKMEILYPLIRKLKLNPSEIFYPETQHISPSIQELRIIIAECNEQEAAALIPVIKSVVSVIRDKDARTIK